MMGGWLKLRDLARGDFIKKLNDYYFHLLTRWENGSEYLIKNPNNERALQLYKGITNELKLLQELKKFL